VAESLLESELFGYEEGAFTGSRRGGHAGLFEAAHRGTLFLDEIGELPLSLQAKILRALEEKRFERVGGLAAIQVDVRVVAATNRNLKAAVAARQYREDLYFRLSVFPITIPPLRDRAHDIPTLAKFFVDRFCRDENKRPLALTASAIEALMAHQWRGNVRELQNCIERAVILTEGDAIHARHLNLPSASAPANAAEAEASDPWDALDLSGSLAEVTRRITAEAEKRKIAQVLHDSGGDVGRASEILQVPFKALNARLRHYKLEER
jgi:transcriptional regulator with GAF, ATPase, and Fis domain